MNAMAVPALLTDNEVLRSCLRERDAAAMAVQPVLCVRQWLRPPALARVQAALLPSMLPLPTEPEAWPEPLQQLHWELSASTTLRPLAHLMGKGALLPDPWNVQGGLRDAQAIWPAVLPQHPRTRLYTVLRVEVLLQGNAVVSAAEWNASLTAGDVLVCDAVVCEVSARVTRTGSTDARWWVGCLYAPDPCCCRQSTIDNRQ